MAGHLAFGPATIFDMPQQHSQGARCSYQFLVRQAGSISNLTCFGRVPKRKESPRTSRPLMPNEQQKVLEVDTQSPPPVPRNAPAPWRSRVAYLPNEEEAGLAEAPLSYCGRPLSPLPDGS